MNTTATPAERAAYAARLATLTLYQRTQQALGNDSPASVWAWDDDVLGARYDLAVAILDGSV